MFDYKKNQLNQPKQKKRLFKLDKKLILLINSLSIGTKKLEKEIFFVKKRKM